MLSRRSTTRDRSLTTRTPGEPTKIIYAGYFPMGLSLQRIMTEMPNVGFNHDVWPKFLRTNALRVLVLDR